MLFFDLDGTLLDSNGIWLDIDIEFLGRHGIAPVPEDYTEYVTHHSPLDAARYTRERFHLRETAEVQRLPQIVCRGGSCIVDPFGHYVTQPVWDREEIIFAELDMTQAAAAKMELDVCGHYARPDVLRLTVNDR